MKADPVIGVILLGAAACVCGLALKTIPVSVAAHEMVDVRRVAFGKDPVSIAAVDEALTRADAVLAACQPQGVTAVVDLVTWKADQIDPRQDRDAWVADLRQVEDYSRRGLACEPTDGALWARLAFARWFLGGTAEEQAKLLGYSQSYAPSEFAVIRTRFFQWRRVSPAVLALARDHLEADIRTTLLAVPPRDAVDFLSDLPLAVFDMVQEQMPLVPPERIEALQAVKGSEMLFPVP